MIKHSVMTAAVHPDRVRAQAMALEALADQVAGEDFEVSNLGAYVKSNGTWDVSARAVWFS